MIARPDTVCLMISSNKATGSNKSLVMPDLESLRGGRVQVRAALRGDFELNGYKAMFGLGSVIPEGSFVFRLRKQGDRWFLREVQIKRS